MDFTLEQLGGAIGIFMVVIGFVSYAIAKTKSETPFRAALMGAVFSVVPILGIIYVIYLATQEPLTES
jgi:hypothetical protein